METRKLFLILLITVALVKGMAGCATSIKARTIWVKRSAEAKKETGHTIYFPSFLKVIRISTVINPS